MGRTQVVRGNHRLTKSVLLTGKFAGPTGVNMAHRFLSTALSITVFGLAGAVLAVPALPDTSHARIVRLSLVQGDVRFASSAKGDPLTDNKAVWEKAELNLPIRQGYVLATDHGRAEVEFENGAMAFLAENTVLEFYDLSLEDGAHTTRLVLRQGSAEFYVNPARGDYFSVTGGDFSVQAESKATFRLNNFDDGSDVNVLQGHVAVLTKGKNTPVKKGESLSMKAGDADSMAVARLPESDEFDQWVSGRIDSAVTVSTAALQYSDSYAYTAGFGDLYTYGSWFPVAGYGYCWRPYGVGLGWSPFDFGNWFYDPVFGWTFVGSQPWGWLPYHFGGWLFQPGYGWIWNSGGSFGRSGPTRWRPVTAVWVRSGGLLGLVPVHPMDARSRTPLNMSHGIFPVTQRGVSNRMPVTETENWKIDKRPPRNVFPSTLTNVGSPARLSRSIAAESPVLRSTSPGRESSIVYDPGERRFVNSNAGVAASSEARMGIERRVISPNGAARSADSPSFVPGRAVSNRAMTDERNRIASPPPRAAMPPRPVIAPPSVPRSMGGGSRDAGWGASAPRSSGGFGGGASMPRASGGSAPSGGGARSAPAPSGGGRPH